MKSQTSVKYITAVGQKIIIIIILKTGLLVANVTANAQMFIMGLLLLISIIIPNIMNYYREKHG